MAKENNFGRGTASAGQSATPFVGDDGAVKNAIKDLAAPASQVCPGVPVPACSKSLEACGDADKAGARGDVVGRGLAADRAKPDPIVWPPEKPGVPYVRLSSVADVVGLSEHCVHHTWRPLAWGIPGDWLLVRGGPLVAYRLGVLPGLVRELEVNGQRDRAAWLKVFVAGLQAELDQGAASGKLPWYRKDQYE